MLHSLTAFHYIFTIPLVPQELGFSQDFDFFNTSPKHQFQICAHPNLASQLLQFCQIRQLALHPCPRRWFVRKRYGYQPQKVKIKKSSQELLLFQKGVFQEIACPKVIKSSKCFSHEFLKLKFKGRTDNVYFTVRMNMHFHDHGRNTC